jgi:hypothetical protein
MAGVDLFAGAGGWDVYCAELGIDALGIELDPQACETRAAAGFRTLQADVSKLDPVDYPCDILIASPPCTAFSMAGKGMGESEGTSNCRVGSRPRPRPNTTERGYGAAHKALRAQYATTVDAGLAACARCKQPIPPGGRGRCPAIRHGHRCGRNHDGWDLGHSDFDRSRYTGPEHVCCNRATTGRKRAVNAARRALRVSREW